MISAGLESCSVRADIEYCSTTDWSMCAVGLIGFKATAVR